MAAAVSLGAKASPTFPFIPDHYVLAREQLQAVVAQRFPVHGSMAQMVDMTLTNPAVALRPSDNRLVLTMDASVASAFLPQTVAGALTVAGRLAYDAATHSVVVRSLQMEKADFGPVMALYGDQINVAANLVTQLLENAPVYTFKPQELSFAGVQFAPGAMTVTPQGLRVDIVELPPNAQNRPPAPR